MELLLQRTTQTAVSTQGQLFLNGHFLCYTLEPVVREQAGVPVAIWKSWGKAAVPAGTYRIEIATFTGDHGESYDAPLLENVPGFAGVYIHIGNYPQDTDGCILVGTTPGDDEVDDSQVAFDALFPQIAHALQGGDGVTICVAPPETAI